MEKAYKILAMQRSISNKRAKELIDRGLVYIGGKKVRIARAEVDENTKFRIVEPADATIIYQDEDIVAIDKPAMIDSEEIEMAIEGAKLIHRLDRETSGVLLLSRNESFRRRAVDEFRAGRVFKEYSAWVEGRLFEEMTIDSPIYTVKKGSAFSMVDNRRGKPAITRVYPDEVQGRKSKVRIVIETGRTHQIRVHLSHAGHPVVGDEKYGSPTETGRILLHAGKVILLGREYISQEPADIKRYK